MNSLTSRPSKPRSGSDLNNAFRHVCWRRRHADRRRRRIEPRGEGRGLRRVREFDRFMRTTIRIVARFWLVRNRWPDVLLEMRLLRPDHHVWIKGPHGPEITTRVLHHHEGRGVLAMLPKRQTHLRLGRVYVETSQGCTSEEKRMGIDGHKRPLLLPGERDSHDRPAP